MRDPKGSGKMQIHVCEPAICDGVDSVDKLEKELQAALTESATPRDKGKGVDRLTTSQKNTDGGHGRDEDWDASYEGGADCKGDD